MQREGGRACIEGGAQSSLIIATPDGQMATRPAIIDGRIYFCTERAGRCVQLCIRAAVVDAASGCVKLLRTLCCAWWQQKGASQNAGDPCSHLPLLPELGGLFITH
jgi:hypothetical protein